VIEFIHQNPEVPVAALWIFGALVSTMPPPPANCSIFYQWMYGFFNAIAANLDKVGKKSA